MKKRGNLDSNNLSEGFVSYILSFTSPPDTCRSALVSSLFRSAADSDLVWEKFLPSDYEEIISRSVFPVVFSSKKELYFRLCNNPILVDDGNKVKFIHSFVSLIPHFMFGLSKEGLTGFQSQRVVP